jgi:hypothetical protein
MKIKLITLCGCEKIIDGNNQQVGGDILIPMLLPMRSVSLFEPSLAYNMTSSNIVTRKFQYIGHDYENNLLEYQEVYEAPSVYSKSPACRHYNKIEMDTLKKPYVQCEDCGEKFYE